MGKSEENGKRSVYRPSKLKNLTNYLKRYWTLHLLLLLPMAYFIVFKYLPMTNIMLAFKTYFIMQQNELQAIEGHPFAWLTKLLHVFNMPWAGQTAKYNPITQVTSITGDPDVWLWFKSAFKNPIFMQALKNTLTLNTLDLVMGFPAPIILALLLNELAFQKFKRVTQTIAYMPHFLSWVIIASIATELLAPSTGIVNGAIRSMGGKQIDFLATPSIWVPTYIFIGIWQSVGWNTIIYLAAITGINPELYEAAAVDGANRWHKIWHITLPGIRSTVIVLLIMNLGRILGSDFDRPYVLGGNVRSVSNVISIFVYDYGLKKGLTDFPLATAVGLFQSVVCVIFLLAANKLAEKFGERGIW